jgi:hypothetical protein
MFHCSLDPSNPANPSSLGQALTKTLPTSLEGDPTFATNPPFLRNVGIPKQGRRQVGCSPYAGAHKAQTVTPLARAVCLTSVDRPDMAEP